MPHHSIARAGLLMVSVIAGCAGPQVPPPSASVALAPTSQPAASFPLDASDVHPMYQHLLAIDLPTVVQIAAADNLDIQLARQRVEASRGQYESSVEAIVPVIAPALVWQHFDGTNQNANGTLVSAAFNDLLPGVSVQWILNPGRVVYDIIASRRRLDAAGDQERAAVLETTRLAADQYYDLVLAQARLAVAKEAMAEGEELLRIASARVRAGTGLPADELRAQTDLARRRQDLISALYGFHQASIALTVTLHLDASTTLVPKADEIHQTALVNDDLTIDQLLDTAMQHRPDLRASEELAAALQADTNAVIWGGLGPQLQASYTAGAIQTDNNGHTTALHGQQRASAGGGLAIGLSTFGQAKAAGARERAAQLEMQRRADLIRASVVEAHQASIAQGAIVPLARQEVESSREALRLAQANLAAGTMLTIDVLQAEDALAGARLRFVEAVVRYNQAQVNLRAALAMFDGSEAPAAAATAQ